MCILFVYRDPKAAKNSYRLIVASNRDEVYKRPAKPAHFWNKNPDCFGGTDEEPGKEGGTWLSFSTTGRAGVLLNLSSDTTQGHDIGKGRGRLVVDYLISKCSAKDYLDRLHDINRKKQLYNPYNLILLDMHDGSVDYLSSEQGTSGPQKYLGDVLGVSNSPIDQPYAKVRAGNEEFRKIVTGSSIANQDNLIQDLLRFLKSTKRHLPDPELQKRSPNLHELLSSICVNDESIEYGTRTHTILLVNGSNNVTFFEETKIPDGTWKTQLFQTTLKPE